MNRFTTANVQSGALRYKHLTVGDMRPDATTKLYKRIFKGTGRKYIPVKDVTNDQMGRELNAYLINPEYIDKSVMSPEVVSQNLEPKPVVRALQYSRLSYDNRVAGSRGRTIDRTAALFGAAMKLGQSAVQVIRKTAQRITQTSLHSPFGRTYALGRGMGMHRRRKLFASTGAFAAAMTFGIIGISTIGDHTGTQGPKPVVAPASSSVEGPVTHSGITTTQPIPLFSTPITASASSEASLSASPSIQTSTEQQAPGQPIATEQANVLTAIPSPTTQPMTPEVAGNDTPLQQPLAADTDTTPPQDNVLSSTVETVTDVTTQTLDGVTGLVGGLLGN